MHDDGVHSLLGVGGDGEVSVERAARHNVRSDPDVVVPGFIKSINTVLKKNVIWEIVFRNLLRDDVSRQPEIPQHVLLLLQPNVDDANHVVGGSSCADSTRRHRFFATTNSGRSWEMKVTAIGCF